MSESTMNEVLTSALNQVQTILRDVDCPLDIRVTMAQDVADEALRRKFALHICGLSGDRSEWVSCPACDVIEDQRDSDSIGGWRPGRRGGESRCSN